jgi:cell wall-associated NlpC family hydrolase
MTDQASNAETNSTSLTVDEILAGKTAKEPEKQEEVATKTKAEDNQQANKAEEGVKTDLELEKLRKELEAERKRREDTQKWGNSQRQATLKTIKGLQDKGLAEDEIAEIIGGKDIFERVMKGAPVDQEINNPMSVVNQAFAQQIVAVEATWKVNGHTDEELKEYMDAFNALAYDDPEHRDEMYRRATSGDVTVAAYALKVGKEKLEEYRLSKEIKTKGVKSFEQELREKIKAELLAETSKVKDEVAAELGKSSGKPRLVGGATTTPESKPNDHKSLKDILGQ